MTIVESLSERFSWLERENLRVGSVYLSPEDIVELESDVSLANTLTHAFDTEASAILRARGIRGYLWGATVYVSIEVPSGHVCIIQSGVTVQSIDSNACVKLSYDRKMVPAVGQPRIRSRYERFGEL